MKVVVSIEAEDQRYGLAFEPGVDTPKANSVGLRTLFRSALNKLEELGVPFEVENTSDPNGRSENL
jgi:hypothetical protein